MRNCEIVSNSAHPIFSNCREPSQNITYFPDRRFEHTLRTLVSYVAAWLSGNAFVSINVVALRWARLVLGWVTVRGHTILIFNQSHPDLLSLAIPPWVGTMSTGGGLGHH